MATQKLNAHNTLIINKNACGLFTYLKTNTLENAHPSTRDVDYWLLWKVWVYYYSMINCFVSIWSNVIYLVYNSTQIYSSTSPENFGRPLNKVTICYLATFDLRFYNSVINICPLLTLILYLSQNYNEDIALTWTLTTVLSQKHCNCSITNFWVKVKWTHQAKFRS